MTQWKNNKSLMGSRYDCFILDGDKPIARVYSKEHGDKIVTAVNSHDDLKAQNKAMLKCLQGFVRNRAAITVVDPEHPIATLLDKLMDMSEAAIKAAKP